jgi:GTPase SAR1 family protein
MGVCASQPQVRHKVVMLGLANAGKSCTLAAMVGAVGQSTIPTVGSSVTELTYKGIGFDLHDVGGQDHLRELWRYHYTGAEGIIFVVDSCDTEAFEAAREALFGALSDPALNRARFVAILANKRDGDGAASLDAFAAAMHYDKLNTVRANVNARIFLTIATQNDGLNDVLHWIVGELKSS